MLIEMKSLAPADRTVVREALDRAGIATGQRGPWLQLLSEVLLLAGPRAEFHHHAERPWSSATFAGSRHSIALCFSGADALADGEAFMAALPDHEFEIPRHLVADAVIAASERTPLPAPVLAVEVEILVLEDI